MKIAEIFRIMLLINYLVILSGFSTKKIKNYCDKNSRINGSFTALPYFPIFKKSRSLLKSSAYTFDQVTTVSSLINGYSNLIEIAPLQTKMITGGLIGIIGDSIIQIINNKGNMNFDFRRLLVFMLVSTFYTAPIIHNWFQVLDHLPFLTDMPAALKSFCMVLIDQTFGAISITAGFFIFFELAQGLVRSILPYDKQKQFPPIDSFLNEGLKSCGKNLARTLIANWTCWPIINFFNFLLVPIQYRVLVVNVVSIFWNMYLSNVANQIRDKD